MSWENTLKRWVGFCPACRTWRNEEMSKQQGDKWYCKKSINWLGFRGDAEMYVRENLERFDKLDWDRRINGCGMQLLNSQDELQNLKAYSEFSDLRDM
tara:strand:+ start:452 stop:745 length:294 start_codon:yes stop_codon:yes gene_type:complete